MEMIGFRILPTVLVCVIGFVGAATAVETFRDCSDCPVMVNVQAGTFIMGSTAAETTREEFPSYYADNERPQHSVTFTREFALGHFVVTQGEFAAFIRDSGYEPASGCHFYNATNGRFVLDQKGNWQNPGFAQSNQHPAVCVSHDDAQRYVQWLSRKTGKSYRLPTEAEWEYAARAGTATTRFWGDGSEEACNFANVRDFTAVEALNWNLGNKNDVFQCRDGYVHTAPVGSFRPNRFGLYDMLGNVSQWTEDCYRDSYIDAPVDGSAVTSGDCKSRVVRGGAWDISPRFLRSATRNWSPTVNRINLLGFRVGMSL
jgi:formylglycine-generating enzyme